MRPVIGEMVKRCSREEWCSPFKYLLDRGPHAMPWVMFETRLTLKDVPERCVVIRPAKRTEYGGKQFLLRHCPFCGEIIDPTIVEKPRPWWKVW